MCTLSLWLVAVKDELDTRWTNLLDFTHPAFATQQKLKIGTLNGCDCCNLNGCDYCKLYGCDYCKLDGSDVCWHIDYLCPPVFIGHTHVIRPFAHLICML